MEKSGVLRRRMDEQKDDVQSKIKSIAYIYSKEHMAECDRGFKVKRRASMVHELIRAYDLLPFLNVVPPKVATSRELTEFHSQDYIEYLIEVNELEDLEKMDEISLEYGLGYDCPLMPRMFDYVARIAGGTLSAAQCLIEGTHKIVVNWTGGWHHGKKDEASGFCYVNDIVLGILKLRSTFDKVLYVDLDLHHGDGVEDAFAFTTKVMTVSLHKYEAGFFPGSGNVTDVGCGRARVCRQVKERFDPNVVVCQCGADVLSGDPMSSFCLTEKSIGLCVREILSWDLPTLFLGGGGYNFPNTARCWTYLTSIIVGQNISSDVPDNSFFVDYGPGYDLEITAANQLNCNDAITTNQMLRIVSDNLKNINTL